MSLDKELHNSFLTYVSCFMCQQPLVGILSHVCRYDSVICIDIISHNVGHLKNSLITQPLWWRSLQYLRSRLLIGHLHAIVFENCSTEARPRVSSFHPNTNPTFIFIFFKERKVNLTFPDFPFTTTISLTGQLSTYCCCRQWVFRAKPITWKEEVGKKEEKSLIVAELMCFCLLWIVSSSPL